MDEILIKLLYDGDISKLKEVDDFDPNRILKDENGKVPPLWIALSTKNFELLEFLFSKGVLVENKNFQAILSAIINSDEKTIRYLVSKGASIHTTERIFDAYWYAIVFQRYDKLKLIDELGHSVKEHAGGAFLEAVDMCLATNKTPPNAAYPRNLLDEDGIYEVLDFFTDRNVDVNYSGNGMWHHRNETPLCVTARCHDLKRCKYLVEHGASITIADNEAKRPYIHAILAGKKDIAEYLKNLEGEELHSQLNKIYELKKLPKKIIDFIQGENLRLELNDNEFNYIDFHSLMKVSEFKIGRSKFVLLSENTGHKDGLQLVWIAKTKQFGSYDTHSKEVKELVLNLPI